MIPLSEIVKAKRQLAGVVTNTPCALAPILSEEVGTNVYLKKENLQITGAYKLRGAYNKIASLTKEVTQTRRHRGKCGQSRTRRCLQCSSLRYPSNDRDAGGYASFKSHGNQSFGCGSHLARR